MKTIFKNAITCSTDYNYVNYVSNLIRTLEKVDSKIEVFVRLVDFTDIQINEFKEKYNVNIIIDNPNLSEEKTLFKTKNKQELKHVYGITNILDIKKVLYSPRSFYTCHSRFKSIKELLEKNYNVLSLDCDTLVLQNFDNIFKQISHDICTVKNPENEDIFSNEGFLYFKNNSKVKEFINNINNFLFENKNYLDWNGDHKALHNFYNKTLSLRLLNKKYKDKDHNDDSIMWSGDGKNKYEEKFTSNLG